MLQFRRKAGPPLAERAGSLVCWRCEPYHHTREADSMDHATATKALLATHFATSLFPLTVRLIPVVAQIASLIVHFRKADVTPQTSYRFEAQLKAQLRELGRMVLEWTFTHL